MVLPVKKFLSLLFLTACFGSDYTIRPDSTVGPDIMNAAHAAAADWEAHVPVKISFSDAPCSFPRKLGDVCVHAVSSIPTVPWEQGQLAGYTLLTEMWLVAPDFEQMSASSSQRVFAHEMGHAMGLLHTGPGTLMYPYGDKGSKTVTVADVAQWYHVRGKNAP